MTALIVALMVAAALAVILAAVLPIAWQAREKRRDTSEFEQSDYGRGSGC